MSKNAPAIPLFTDAYLADTRHLSLEEHGAYLQLLMVAWRSTDCSLPDDDKRLARVLGVTPAKWAKLKGTVMAFWDNANGHWTQKRLTKERKFVDEKRAANSSSAKSRWNKQGIENKGSGEYERISERNAPPPPPIAAKAASAREEKSEGDAVSLMIALHKAAGLVPPDPANNWAKHSEAIALTASWLKAGADPAMLEKCVAARAKSSTMTPKSLKYYDGAVRDQLEAAAGQQAAGSSLAEQILKRNAAA